MALAFSIDENTFNSLESGIQGFYTKQDDGNYQLTVDGLPNTDGLKAKNDELLGETKKEREKRKELERQLAEIQAEKEKQAEETAKKNGDLETLENSYKEKLAKIESDKGNEIKALQEQIYQLTVGQKANDIANQLAIKGSASVLLPHIQNRLTLKTGDDGTNEIRVLDLQGNLSAQTIDDLILEFKANDAFKPLIAGVQSSGSGATQTGGGATGSTLKRSEMNAEQKREYVQKHGQKAFLSLPK